MYLEIVALAATLVLWDLGRRFVNVTRNWARVEDVKDLRVELDKAIEIVHSLQGSRENHGRALAGLEHVPAVLDNHTKVLANHASALKDQGTKITSLSTSRMFGAKKS